MVIIYIKVQKYMKIRWKNVEWVGNDLMPIEEYISLNTIKENESEKDLLK